MQAPEILTDMLGGVQGVAQPRGYDTYIYPTAAYYPSVTPINGVNNPNLCPNEISEPPTEQVYIRAIGSTTGTLDRMKRIVHKQRSFYERRNAAVPQWLDAEFLYRINYGPGTREDLELARETLQLAKDRSSGRLSVTLLDREMAQTLHRAIFSKSREKSLFKTDWTEADVDDQVGLQIFPSTPFDYPSCEEAKPLLWCEEYIVFTLWSRRYSSSILGPDRPPMAGVARDIITLIDYLNNEWMRGTLSRQPLLSHLKEFNLPLFSLPPPLNKSLDPEWASRGLFADFFNIAIALGRRDYGRDGLEDLNSAGSMSFGSGVLEPILYPGPDALKLGRSPVPRDDGTIKQLWGTLDEMRAVFINSGPYEIVLSTSPSDHLTLNSYGKLRVFWEGPSFWVDGIGKSLYPGHDTFAKYKWLTLGKQLQADTLYDEVLRTYALLFTRDEGSKRIAERLFNEHNADLLIAGREKPGSENSMTMVTRSIAGKRRMPTGRCVVIPEWSVFFEGQVPMYAHFDHYCGHFAVLQKQMVEWKPQKVSELLQPGYRDRFSWYTTWVTILFAFLGVLVIATSILQTYWGYQGTQAAIQSLALQKLQMNITS